MEKDDQKEKRDQDWASGFKTLFKEQFFTAYGLGSSASYSFRYTNNGSNADQQELTLRGGQYSGAKVITLEDGVKIVFEGNFEAQELAQFFSLVWAGM